MQNYSSLQNFTGLSQVEKEATPYELSARITELSNLISPSHTPKSQPATDPEINTTLQFALLAMEEAEKRIKRQEIRIQHLESSGKDFK
jgi:hypothetical protein